MSNGGAERVTLEALEVEGIKNILKISKIIPIPQKSDTKYARESFGIEIQLENIFNLLI